MVKALGIKKIDKCNSSQTISNNVDDDKWLSGIHSQIISINGDGIDANVDVRAIPINLIKIDPTNPRELDIEPDEIIKHIDVLRLPKEAFLSSDQWVDDYTKNVKNLFGDTKKAKDRGC